MEGQRDQRQKKIRSTTRGPSAQSARHASWGIRGKFLCPRPLSPFFSSSLLSWATRLNTAGPGVAPVDPPPSSYALQLELGRHLVIPVTTVTHHGPEGLRHVQRCECHPPTRQGTLLPSRDTPAAAPGVPPHTKHQQNKKSDWTRADHRHQVHKLCQQSAERLLADVQPQLMIAIGGGGYVPARILRSFLKKSGSPNIPIQAIGLSLYETLGNAGDGQVEIPGTKVTRTQWLDLSALGEMENLVGKRVLIVDEVDDTRTTLEYAVKELEKDVEAARQRLGGDQPKTQFSIFVLHVSLPPFSHCTPNGVANLYFRCCRTRTSRRRAFCPTTWSAPGGTWRRGPSATSGSATPGRRPTLTSTTGWPRRTVTAPR